MMNYVLFVYYEALDELEAYTLVYTSLHEAMTTKATLEQDGCEVTLHVEPNFNALPAPAWLN